MNNRYGTLKSEISRINESGKVPILDLDIVGATAVKKLYPDSLIVYIAPRVFEDLEKRLVQRGSEDDESIKVRL